jgi:thiamine biosynthesis protein ThiI
MRRFMMRIAEGIARKEGCGALITGESLGQVASQTMQAIGCTDCVATMPVFRPLIGMDKTEIVEIARRIGTFETSIEPYEDCCTVFTPKHPRTRPDNKFVELAEQNMDVDALVERCVNETRYCKIGYREQA